ncbi:hypothetical protein Poly41_24060 [Novipirellula artificiosorum]|uniref:Uncharacterized protein n=1 Tax=Novipirellula artificiosorum TaxID=2528016 RepID=A0A5C6DVR3_9BACT|nr:hypothetical protein Poly41_24060 [Novipirellula artificiosorum]
MFAYAVLQFYGLDDGPVLVDLSSVIETENVNNDPAGGRAVVRRLDLSVGLQINEVAVRGHQFESDF